VIPREGWLAGHSRAHGEPGVVATARLIRPPHLRAGITRSGRAHWWNLSSASLSLERTLFERVGGYDPSFADYGGEDPELGYRLRALGARFVAVPEAVAEHWDERFELDLERKAFAAGRAHARVWRKHGDPRIALALGIHPAVAAVKGLLLNDLVGRVVHGSWYRYERAYLAGARAESCAPERAAG
jgi:GT2 family glycosyltransferase